MRMQQRDAEFKDFYSGEVARLRRLALFVSASPADAEPYVRRTLVNLCRSHHRRKALERRKAPQPAVPTMQPDPAEAMRVAQALSVLSPIKRAVVVMRFYEDMSEADIARILDRPLNTVKSDLRRALVRLRPELGEGVTAQ